MLCKLTSYRHLNQTPSSSIGKPMSQFDQLHRYIFESRHVRGELVQISDAYAQMLDKHNHQPCIKKLIGELLAATSLLTATLKFEGDIAVQVQGDGPLRFAVINGNHNQEMRAAVRLNTTPNDNASLHELLGKGQMVITISPNEGERYQGIVPLEKPTLAECLEDYFQYSEQLRTRLWIEVDTNDDTLKASGMLLQVLPANVEQSKDDFDHLEALTNTITRDELLTLDATQLLTRLYHEDNPQLFAPAPVIFKCTCSREKSQNAILNLGSEDIMNHVNTVGPIDITCEYCKTNYHFDINELIELARAH